MGILAQCPVEAAAAATQLCFNVRLFFLDVTRNNVGADDR